MLGNTNWQDIALSQLNRRFETSGEFVAYVLNIANINTKFQIGKWSPDILKIRSSVLRSYSVWESVPGDLLFWGLSDSPYKVAIYLGGGYYIGLDAREKTIVIRSIKKHWFPSFAGSHY
ncbi:hydrolase [Leuconostoc falkenbergense]|uniref:NlpC/P60 family protein n=1 Tax=Leuconostoc falkenbergense TaxID=2766470 RepID=UPI0024ACFAD2|nr:NlpC/P60 family protein [Leuconostoc falkenbergense]MDI6667982.1 hydrolase [Leuconostoc falkenbergense]